MVRSISEFITSPMRLLRFLIWYLVMGFGIIPTMQGAFPRVMDLPFFKLSVAPFEVTQNSIDYFSYIIKAKVLGDTTAKAYPLQNIFANDAVCDILGLMCGQNDYTLLVRQMEKKCLNPDEKVMWKFFHWLDHSNVGWGYKVADLKKVIWPKGVCRFRCQHSKATLKDMYVKEWTEFFQLTGANAPAWMPDADESTTWKNFIDCG